MDITRIKNWVQLVLRRIASDILLSPQEISDGFDILEECTIAQNGGTSVDSTVLMTDIRVGIGHCIKIAKSDFDKIQELLCENRKIEAIKLLRAIKNLSLKEAKDTVENSCNWRMDYEKRST